MKNLTKEMVVRYFSTIMPHFHCQSQLQNDRNTFYRILQQIFLNRLDGNNYCLFIMFGFKYSMIKFNLCIKFLCTLH